MPGRWFRRSTPSLATFHKGDSDLSFDSLSTNTTPIVSIYKAQREAEVSSSEFLPTSDTPDVRLLLFRHFLSDPDFLEYCNWELARGNRASLQEALDDLPRPTYRPNKQLTSARTK